jgi:hypothetical protein
VTLAVLLTPEYVAVKVAEMELVIVPAVTEKMAEIAPCGTVTLEGTLAAVVLELESETRTPPEPAAAVRLTVPVADLPLVIAVGLTVILLSAGTGGLTVALAVMLTPE